MIGVCLLLVLGAPAGGGVGQAKLFFESGKRAFDSGEYEAAIAAFEQAHEIAPRPALYFSMGQAYRLQFTSDGRIKGLQTAARLYARYLAEAPKGRRRADAVEHLAAVETILVRRGDAPAEEGNERKTQLMVSANVKAVVQFEGSESPAPLIREIVPGPHTATVSAAGYRTQIVERTAVAGRLVVAHVEMEELPSHLTVTGAGGADLRIDGEHVGTLPVTGFRLTSGEHRLQILGHGKRVFDQMVTFKRGEDVDLPVELKNSGRRITAHWLLGMGGISVVRGAVLLAMALVAESRAKEVQTRLMGGESLTAADIETFQSQDGRRDEYTVAAVSSLSTTAVALIIGGLLYLLDSPRVVE